MPTDQEEPARRCFQRGYIVHADADIALDYYGAVSYNVNVLKMRS